MGYSKEFEYRNGIHRQTSRLELTETLLIRVIAEAREARTFCEKQLYDKMHLHCIRIHAILNELNRSLDKRYTGEFCRQQTALYGYCFEALRKGWHMGQQDAFATLEEVLEGIYKNWKECMQKVRHSTALYTVED